MTGLGGLRPALPIDALLPEIGRVLQERHSLVIEAAPGAGKTTRVPAWLLDLVRGEVLVLEPRRIAARLGARRVAAERGEPVGETVGFHVRYETVSGPRTRLRFLTEGVLTRRLLSDPDLRGVDAVILDEFHERHLETDLALALLKRLQERRPELKLIVMSATLDAGPIAAYLGGCPVLHAAARAFPLEVRYQPYSAAPLEEQVRGALEALFAEGHRGDVLVFLPGAAEIRRAMRASESALQRVGGVALPLHGDLPPEEQDRALAPSLRQKVVFATNLAESSVTIEGVTAVVDSGLARQASHSPWTGLPTLEVRRVSQASAVQRAGRAGRTGPGTAVRLYPQEDFAQRPTHEAPEILRSDLSGLCLTLRALGGTHAQELPWLSEPPAKALEHAEGLLGRLRAEGQDAREMAALPVSPRLARLLLEATRRGVPYAGIHVAALLGSGVRPAATDLQVALDEVPGPGADRQIRQLRRLLRPDAKDRGGEDALLLAVLAGFPDRVGQRRAGQQVLLANGVTVEMQGQPLPYEFLVVLDVEDRPERAMPLARLTARVEPEWLLDLFADQIEERVSLEWHAEAERVDEVSALMYGAVVLQASQGRGRDPEAVAGLLAEKAMQRGLAHFVDAEALAALLARAAFAGAEMPDLEGLLREVCRGLGSFRELRQAGEGLLAGLERAAGRDLGAMAPATLRLPGGRTTKVHYEAGKPPWIASRLQDFFGMTTTPRVGRERVAVVCHLLAPNQRAVQTTADLDGFWDRLYPQVRRELMRRYPRHAWPEDPRVPVVAKAR